MINCTVNCTTDASATFTIHFIDLLDICEYCINVLFGLPTHTYIIWLIITGAGSGIASEIFFINLSFCEIGICLNCLFLLFYYFPFSQYLACLTNFSMFLQGLILTGHPLFQCLICVERYLAVIHPVTFLKYKPLRYRLISCTAVWIITLGSCLCCMFMLVSFSCHIYVWFFSIQFLVFLSVQLFCCVAVLRALKQSGPGERGREREEENHMKGRAFDLILITTVSSSVTYVPYTITGFLVVTQQNKQTIEVIWSFSLVCFVFAGFVQPVLHQHRAEKLTCFCST